MTTQNSPIDMTNQMSSSKLSSHGDQLNLSHAHLDNFELANKSTTRFLRNR